jgi:glycosyltransferase involved in cell wall biosynthesis
MKPRALFLVPSDYEDLCKKGVAPLITERDENGFFEKVVTVHPAARRDQLLDLTPDQRLYEIREYFLPFSRGLKALRYLHHLFHIPRVVKKLLTIIDQERPDLIRATDPVFTGFLAWIVTRFRPLPFCVSIHADYDKRHELDPAEGAPTIVSSRGLGRVLERFVLRRASLVLPIRATLAEKIQQWGVSADKIRVIPHGIDLDPFRRESQLSPRRQLGLRENIQILSFVGRLSKDNYVYDIVELALELRKVRSDFVIVMSGDGTERAALEKAIATHQLEDWLKIVGFQSRDYVIALRKESSVSLCLMAGYSLIEACAAGHPVIAYDVEWHSELVKTGVTGRLVPEHDVQGLFDAVVYLLDHPAESDRMGVQAKDLAFERHDVKKTSALKRQYYQELLTLRPSHKR